MKNNLYNYDGESHISNVPESSFDMLFCNLEGIELDDMASFVRNCIFATNTKGYCTFLLEKSQVKMFKSCCYPFIFKEFTYWVDYNGNLKECSLLIAGIYPINDSIAFNKVYSFQEKITEFGQKPAAFYQDLILSLTKTKDVIGDLFMNRGAFLKSVIALNRSYVGCEQNKINYMLATNEIRKAEIYNHSLSDLKYYPMYAIG